MWSKDSCPRKQHDRDQLRAFLESLETFWLDFGHDKSHCTLKIKALSGTKLWYKLHVSHLKDMLKQQLCRMNSHIFQMTYRGRILFRAFEKRAPAGLKTQKLDRLSIKFAANVNGKNTTWSWFSHHFSRFPFVVCRFQREEACVRVR